MDIPAFIAIPIRLVFLIVFAVVFVIGTACAAIACGGMWLWQIVTDR